MPVRATPGASGELAGTSVPAVRVIGGTARGRPLRAPRSAGVRPTADRVREAIFDVLSHLDAIAGAEVLDGFAGSGALGIEALSRGAGSVTFVESDRRVLAGLEANLASTGFVAHPGVRVVVGDLIGFLAGGRRRFDLVLLDPPYAFPDWGRLLDAVAAEVVVIESDREVPLPEHWEFHRSYRYGTTLVTVARAPLSTREVGPATREVGPAEPHRSRASGVSGPSSDDDAEGPS